MGKGKAGKGKKPVPVIQKSFVPEEGTVAALLYSKGFKKPGDVYVKGAIS